MILRYERFAGKWSVNVTRFFYLSNGSYRGEKRWFIRLGLWPGWSRSFGPVRR